VNGTGELYRDIKMEVVALCVLKIKVTANFFINFYIFQSLFDNRLNQFEDCIEEKEG